MDSGRLKGNPSRFKGVNTLTPQHLPPIPFGAAGEMQNIFSFIDDSLIKIEAAVDAVCHFHSTVCTIYSYTAEQLQIHPETRANRLNLFFGNS